MPINSKRIAEAHKAAMKVVIAMAVLSVIAYVCIGSAYWMMGGREYSVFFKSYQQWYLFFVLATYTKIALELIQRLLKNKSKK